MSQDPMSQDPMSTSQSTSQLPAPALVALLRRQAGVVSRAQAVRAGLTATHIDRLVARRRWVPLHPRVYRASKYRLTDEARLRAAVLWAGDGAVPARARGAVVARPAARRAADDHAHRAGALPGPTAGG